MTPYCSACGYAVEWVRSCFSSAWRFDPNSDLRTKGRYYFVPDSTPFYPGGHHFWSRDWTSKEAAFIPGTGEQRDAERTYFPGWGPKPLPGRIAVGGAACLAEGAELPTGLTPSDLVAGIPVQCWSLAGLPIPFHPYSTSCTSDCASTFYVTGVGKLSTACTSDCATGVYSPFLSSVSTACTSDCADGSFVEAFPLNSTACTSDCVDSLAIAFLVSSSLVCTSDCVDSVATVTFPSLVCTSDCAASAYTTGVGPTFNSTACTSDCATSAYMLVDSYVSTACTSDCATSAYTIADLEESPACTSDCVDTLWVPAFPLDSTACTSDCADDSYTLS